jgi:hypothetical protein
MDLVQRTEDRVPENVSACRIDRINLALESALLVALEDFVTDLPWFQGAEEDHFLGTE